MFFPPRTKNVNGVIIEDKPIEKLAYADSHGVGGANTLPLVFELVKMIRPRVSVVIGTGDGLIPRLIREAQLRSLSKNSITYLIDLGATMGAMPEKIHDLNSDFRNLYPEIIVFKGRSVPDGIRFLREREKQIDVLWIDGDHSYSGSRMDFAHFSPLVSETGLIFLHDTAPNGAGVPQPAWCGVDKTIDYIRYNHKGFELLNFTSTPGLDFGKGLAVLKRDLTHKPRPDPDSRNLSSVLNTIQGKRWDYLYTKQFYLRQRLVASLLADSPFVLDVGCFPISIGDYLGHDRYLAVDPLYPADSANVRRSLLRDLKFDMKQVYDLVLLGIDIPVDETMIRYCAGARKIVIEYPICYEPSAQKTRDIQRQVTKSISYDFNMDFSGIPIRVDPRKSWPPRYVRRILVLE